MTLGPVQLLILGFDDPRFHGEIQSALGQLRDSNVICLIDAIVINKDLDGDVEIFRQTDLSSKEPQGVGAYAAALVGLDEAGDESAVADGIVGTGEFSDDRAFDESDVWYAADQIPNGTAAAVALIEHRWAIPLRSAIAGAGGSLLADRWIHPDDLMAIGLQAADDATPVQV